MLILYDKNNSVSSFLSTQSHNDGKAGIYSNKMSLMPFSRWLSRWFWLASKAKQTLERIKKPVKEPSHKRVQPFQGQFSTKVTNECTKWAKRICEGKYNPKYHMDKYHLCFIDKWKHYVYLFCSFKLSAQYYKRKIISPRT